MPAGTCPGPPSISVEAHGDSLGEAVEMRAFDSIQAKAGGLWPTSPEGIRSGEELCRVRVLGGARTSASVLSFERRAGAHLSIPSALALPSERQCPHPPSAFLFTPCLLIALTRVDLRMSPGSGWDCMWEAFGGSLEIRSWCFPEHLQRHISVCLTAAVAKQGKPPYRSSIGRLEGSRRSRLASNWEQSQTEILVLLLPNLFSWAVCPQR